MPEMKEELIHRQGGLWDGELKRIDLSLERMKEQEARLCKRLDEIIVTSTDDFTDPTSSDEAVSNSSDGVDTDSPEESDFLKTELQRLEQEQTELLLERAKVANQEM